MAYVLLPIASLNGQFGTGVGRSIVGTDGMARQYNDIAKEFLDRITAGPRTP